MTLDTVRDLLAQSDCEMRVLLIAQGVEPSDRAQVELFVEEHYPRVMPWWHDPPLPSLGATWNAGLDFAWSTGVEHALVVNNDVRCFDNTYTELADVMANDPMQPYFVSAINDPDRFEANDRNNSGGRGGPDFSFFLISKEGHARYRFCELHVPAYSEDLCYHRTLMLTGDGHRIFSVPFPYKHLASGTLNSLSPEKRAQLEKAIDGSRRVYETEWGGAVNEETFDQPFGPEQRIGVTTPLLFSQIRERWNW